MFPPSDHAEGGDENQPHNSTHNSASTANPDVVIAQLAAMQQQFGVFQLVLAQLLAQNNPGDPLINLLNPAPQPPTPQQDPQPVQHALALTEQRGAPPPHHNTDSIPHPLNTNITLEPYPAGFKIPQLEIYDGTKDPDNHLHAFYSCMQTQNASDALMCKIFPSTLQGNARTWYYSLPLRSISSYIEMASTFATKFSSRRLIRKTTSKLMQVKQRDGESLKNYMGRFNDAVLEVNSFDQSVGIAVVILSLNHERFRDSLIKHPATTFNEGSQPQAVRNPSNRQGVGYQQAPPPPPPPARIIHMIIGGLEAGGSVSSYQDSVLFQCCYWLTHADRNPHCGFPTLHEVPNSYGNSNTTGQPGDMLGIPTLVSQHKLSTNPLKKPVTQKRRLFGGKRLQVIKEEVEKLLQAGFVRKVDYCEWVANSVLVKKANGKWQMCIDYTNLNQACPKNCYSMPSIDKLVETASGNERLSLLNAYSGYHQVPMALEDEEKTSFYAADEIYSYVMMPFGLKNAGATYQKMVTIVFRAQIGRNLKVYVNDIVVKEPESFMVSQRGIEVNLEKIRAIAEMKPPKSVKDIQRLTGRVAALHRFISKSADKCLPFFKIMRLAAQKDESDGYRSEHALKFNFDATNNMAEYEALLLGLQLALELKVRAIQVYSDSQLVVNQVNSIYEVVDLVMVKYVALVAELKCKFQKFCLNKIPRTENE
ncbi:hypothetical protein SLEP1_g31999 [Rubroshorea leprosula]|uniref:Uncharacterized protein n=1 Tax=Rubroshorea leprosula TaxID=152421 RepID=A0AAV5KC21_9ROSI|nr:hypothetical protein SLEP1_g31999 [Rubroshorea leprosula]